MGRRALVIDDNVLSAETVQMVLEGLGYKVALAYDGASALVEGAREAPDLVLVDIRLSDMMGSEVVREFRQNPGFSKTHIIAMSGFSDETYREAAFQAGCNDYLVKPINFAALETQLARLN